MSATTRKRAAAAFCITSALYEPHMGGVEGYTANLARQIARKGHRVIVLTNRIDTAYPLFQMTDGVEVVRVPCRPLMDARYPVPLHTADYRLAFGWLGRQPIGYHVVNTRFYPLSVSAARLAQQQGVQPIVIEHGSAHLVAGRAAADAGVAAVEHAFTRSITRYARDFYGVSAACCTWLSHFGITAKGVLPNSIDAARYASAASSRDFRAELDVGADDFLVCFAGRYIPEKGVRQLLEAARSLPQDSCIHVAFAGKGPLEEEIREQANARIHELGALAPPDVAALLKTSDAFCLPSRSEGFSTTLLETAACGTAPVITRVGGTDELIPDDRFGVLLDDASPACVGRALIQLAENRSECREKGIRLQARVSTEFSWEATAEKTIQACMAAQETASVRE